MNGSYFVDSNIAIYALDPVSSKGRIAAQLLKDGPVLSTQVIMETVNVLLRKLRFSRHDAYEEARFLLFNSNLVVLSQWTMLKAFEISERYDYSHWDSLIIAAALEAECTTLYSEDLKDGQTIDGRLTIFNPFVEH